MLCLRPLPLGEERRGRGGEVKKRRGGQKSGAGYDRWMKGKGVRYVDFVFSSSQFKYWYYKQYHINIIIIIIIKK